MESIRVIACMFSRTLVFSCCLILVAELCGQTNTGELRLTVENGRHSPEEAAVQLVSEANQYHRDFKTDATWTLAQTNAIWQTWFNYGATELMIIARLPGSSFDNGPYDRRRIFVPLAKGNWKASKRTLQIEVQDEFIRVLTPTRS